VLAPVFLLGSSWAFRIATLHATQRCLTPTLDAALSPSQHVVLLNALDPGVLSYPLFVREHAGHPRPRSYLVLSMTPWPHQLSRTGPFEIEVYSKQTLVGLPEANMFREADSSFDSVRLPGVQVTVREVGPLGPTRVRFRFNDDLDYGPRRFLVHTQGQIVPVTLPAVGHSTLIPGLPGLRPGIRER